MQAQCPSLQCLWPGPGRHHADLHPDAAEAAQMLADDRRVIESGVPLASIGLLSFSAAAQFAPAMLLGLYWPGANRSGALAGLKIGVLAWIVLMLIPSFGTDIAMLPRLDFNQAAAWSLLLNALAVIVVSLMFRQSAVGSTGERADQPETGLITLGELERTIRRFLGVSMTRDALRTHVGAPGFEASAPATPATMQFCERLLAGSIGSCCTGAEAQLAIITSKMSSIRCMARFIKVVLSILEKIEHIFHIFRVTHVTAVTAVGINFRPGSEDVLQEG